MFSAEQGKRTKRIERLLEVSRHLGTSLELEALLQSVVDAACELSDSQASLLLLYEEETDLLKVVAVSRTQNEPLKRNRLPLERSIAGKVYTESASVVMHNTQKDPRFHREIENAIGIDIFSLLAVPVVFRGEKIGVLEVLNKRNRGRYNEDDAIILETLASQAAVSVLSTLMLEETKRAYHELEELERKKSDFVAIASHELRTPLGIILGHTTVLLDTVEDDEKKHQIEVILRNATRLKDIVEELSEVNTFESSPTPVARNMVDMRKLVDEIVSSFQKTAKSKRIALSSQFTGQKLWVEGDAEKLSVVINNLVENALTFTNKNGHVLVATEKLPGYVKVSVIDDGIGIPQEDLARVFDRFYQVESHLTRKHGGMGLGLTVAKSIVESHAGQIWAESMEGQGSNFTFLLPEMNEEDRTRPLKSNGSLSKPFE
jgi:signal transduction histidine kinase